MDTNWVRMVRGIIGIAALATLVGISPATSVAQGRSGAVYVLTNQSTGNAVMVYRRASDGTLSFSGSFATGGKGAGTGADPLGSQDSLVLGGCHLLLFAVNAGSNSVSVFAVDGLNLRLLDTEPSGGKMPVSVAVHGRLVYVLNASGTPNIAGFKLDPVTNHLLPLPGSQRKLPGGAASAPAEVAFSLDGSVLMVTEKDTNKIDTFTVNDDGLASQAIPHTSHGGEPFGFSAIHRDFAIVSEAAIAALSSYEVDDNGDLELVTGSLGDTQKASCWVVATWDARFAYTANAGSGTISSYTVSRDGQLSLLDIAAGRTAPGGAPTDMALSTDSRFLYVRDGAKNTVDGFRVESDGSLTPVSSASGLPPGAQGVAAR
jgi:6-phosphogluconolactonase